METDKPVNIVRENSWLIAGLSALWFSLTVSPYYPVSLSASPTPSDVATVSDQHLVYALALIAAFAALVAVRTHLDASHARKASMGASLAGLAGSLFFLLAPPETRAIPGLEPVALALVAVYVAFFFVAWMRVASQRSTKHAVVSIGCSFVLFSAVWVVLILIGGHACDGLSALCPAVALVLLRRCDVQDFAPPASESVASLRTLPWGPVALCTAFIYFGSVAVRLFTTMGRNADTLGDLGVIPQLITALGGMAIVGSFTVVFGRRDATGFNVISTVAVLALVNMGALLVVMLGEPTGPFVLAAKRVLVAAEHGAEVLLIAVLAGETARRHLSSMLVFGLAGIVVVVGPQLVGLDLMRLTGLLALLSDSPYVAPLAAVGAFFIAGVAIAMLIRYSGGTAARSRIQGDQWPSDLCRQATAAYDITPRELDVVTYTYRGYSAKKIAETLLVSESTVKAHLSHSYRKLGVHTKQELIALVDSYRDV